jgi:cytochrome c oxidase cbb3-type subunit 3
MSQEKTQSQTVQTTGHAWDGDLQEYNNPIPVWWQYAFYFSVAVAVGYWLIYPAWPVGGGFTTGFDSITYVNDKGEKKTTHWNTRALFLKETNEAVAAQKPYFDKVESLPFEQIVKDPELNSFVVSSGKQLFSDNCAACHQQGGGGKEGFAPNLTDDDWLYGGHFANIQQTITNGRHGYMPAFADVLTSTQIDQLADYVLSLSRIAVNPDSAKAGDALFHSETAACFYCHGDNGKGRQQIGSANLTDRIWLWANVPGADTIAAKEAAVKKVIQGGLNKGVMPSWKDRLSPEQIKVLTVYVHELGGGK